MARRAPAQSPAANVEWESRYPLVLILWTDAVKVTGTWAEIEEAVTERGECVTVGFLIHEDKDYLTVAGTYGLDTKDTSVGNVDRIPRSWTTLMQVLGGPSNAGKPKVRKARKPRKPKKSIGFHAIEAAKTPQEENREDAISRR